MTDKKKKIVLLGGIAIVCVLGLIVLAFSLGKQSAKDQDSQTEVSDEGKEGDLTQTEEPKVEMTAYEDGSYPLEKAMAQAAGYEGIYAGLSEFFQTMYTGGSTGFVEGAALPGVDGSTGDYDPQKAIVFTSVPDYPDAKEDLCLSDGGYGYLVKKDQTLAIVKLDDPMAVQSVISGFERAEEYLIDVQVSGDRLILITSYTQAMDDALGTLYYYTMVYTYGIADRTQPVLMGSVEIEGYYMGSRMTDSGFYVYTSCHKDGFISADGTLLAEEDLDVPAYVPTVNGKVIPADCVYMPEKITDNYYLTVAVIDAELPEEPKQIKTFLSVDAQYYAGENGIFLLLQNGLYQVSSTVLIRLDFTDGNIVLTSAGAVSGSIVGEGGMSESRGLLKLVSSDHSGEISQNYLYVLDSQFGIVAKKEDLASGALIQSVRFMDTQLYLATYGETPIVAVDFSDTANIVEHAYTKPEGFDGLLCGFGENEILGIGYIINKEAQTYSGVRLTMFDVSDPSVIRVTDTVDIQADTTPVATDQTALLLDLEHGLIGFSTEDWDTGYTHVDNFYRVYSYTAEDGFTSVLDASLSQGNCWKSRGFATDNEFFVMDQDANLLKQYDRWNGFVQTGEIQY